MEWVLPAVGLFCVLGIGAVGLAAFALKYALDAVITVKALQNSTHNIQFVPAEQPAGPSSDRALNEALSRGDRQAMEDLLNVSQYQQEPLM